MLGTTCNMQPYRLHIQMDVHKHQPRKLGFLNSPKAPVQYPQAYGSPNRCGLPSSRTSGSDSSLWHFAVPKLTSPLRERKSRAENRSRHDYRSRKQGRGRVVVNGWLKECRGVWMLTHVLSETGRVPTKRPEGSVGLPRWRTRFVPTPQ